MTALPQKPKILVGPYRYWPDGQIIFMKHPEYGDVRVLDVRSWGFLTGQGHAALGLDSARAAAEQDRWGNWVAAVLNLLMKQGIQIVAEHDLKKVRRELEAIWSYQGKDTEFEAAGYSSLAALLEDNDHDGRTVLRAMLDPDLESVSWRPRGIGSNWDIPDLVTGQTSRELRPDCSGFVSSRAEGEVAVRLFKGRAHLDWRSYEPQWCQVKVSADYHVLSKLIELVTANNNMLTTAIVDQAIAEAEVESA